MHTIIKHKLTINAMELNNIMIIIVYLNNNTMSYNAGTINR